MCYLVAKRFEDKGCIALKTRHGKELAEYVDDLQGRVSDGVQLVTISRPSAYGEYEPYNIVPSKSEFTEKVLKM